MQNKDTFFTIKNTLNCRGRLIIMNKPLLMAIINVTPDSFYDGGRYTETGMIIQRAEKCINEGAEILDIGGFSSRPGAGIIPEEEEMNRLSKALTVIRKNFPAIIISVDTFRSNVAKKAVQDFEVDIINDISSGDMDDNMYDTIAELNVPYVMMHMKGTPDTMQNAPRYTDVVQEITAYFARKVTDLHERGIKDIIIDPGFGFGKTVEHNFQILNKLDNFKIFGLPLLVGLSRKSMICKTLSISPENALNGTTVLNTIALLSGVNILRVHDVKEAKQVIELIECYKKTDK